MEAQSAAWEQTGISVPIANGLLWLALSREEEPGAPEGDPRRGESVQEHTILWLLVGEILVGYRILGSIQPNEYQIPI